MNASIDNPVIFGYRIYENIYRGSRTFVYRAIREQDSRPVVIKFLASEYPSFSELLQFRSQFIITKDIQIPGIVRPLSLETYKNSYALVMEDFQGMSLREYTSYQKRQHQESSHLEFLQEFLSIALQLIDILHDLYHHRIIHKDIKPANILINPETKEINRLQYCFFTSKRNSRNQKSQYIRRNSRLFIPRTNWTYESRS